MGEGEDAGKLEELLRQAGDIAVCLVLPPRPPTPLILARDPPSSKCEELLPLRPCPCGKSPLADDGRALSRPCRPFPTRAPRSFWGSFRRSSSSGPWPWPPRAAPGLWRRHAPASRRSSRGPLVRGFYRSWRRGSGGCSRPLPARCGASVASSSAVSHRANPSRPLACGPGPRLLSLGRCAILALRCQRPPPGGCVRLPGRRVAWGWS